MRQSRVLCFALWIAIPAFAGTGSALLPRVVGHFEILPLTLSWTKG